MIWIYKASYNLSKMEVMNIYLFDHNLDPNDTPKYYQRFFVLSYTVHFRYQAITHFNEGMAGIDDVFQTPIITEQFTRKIP